MKHSCFPAFLALAVALALAGALHLVQVFQQAELYPVNRFYLGMDFNDFYRAARMVALGGSPYLVERYVTPPLAATVLSSVAGFPFAVLVPVSFGSCILAVLGGYALACTRLFDLTRAERGLVLGAGVLLYLHSYPFFFLIDRGNVDGFVVLLIVLALLCLRRGPSLPGELAGGLALGLAIALKVYPAVICLALLAQRRWKPVAAVAVTGLALVAVEPSLWLEYAQVRLFARTDQFRYDENGSLANVFQMFQLLLHGAGVALDWRLFVRIAHLVYAALLVTMLYADFRRRWDMLSPTASLMMYFPFMVAFPQLSYHYTYVTLPLLLPALSVVWKNAPDETTRGLVRFAALGLALSQFNAVAWGKLWLGIGAHFVPGIGMTMLLAACVALKLRACSTAACERAPVPAGPGARAAVGASR